MWTMNMSRLISSSPMTTNNGKLRFFPLTDPSTPSKSPRRPFLPFWRRRCIHPLTLFLLVSIVALIYVCYFGNFKNLGSSAEMPSLGSSFWEQHLATEYRAVLNSTANLDQKLILLEPYLLAQIHVINGTASKVEQDSKWQQLRWYFHKARFWDWQSNRVTVGIFASNYNQEVLSGCGMCVF